jgi:hypothetical protein
VVRALTRWGGAGNTREEDRGLLLRTKRGGSALINGRARCDGFGGESRVTCMRTRRGGNPDRAVSWVWTGNGAGGGRELSLYVLASVHESKPRGCEGGVKDSTLDVSRKGCRRGSGFGGGRLLASVHGSHPRCSVHHGPRKGTDVIVGQKVKRVKRLASVWCHGGAVDQRICRWRRGDYQEAGGGGRGRERAG